jgi:hypothetical protein
MAAEAEPGSEDALEAAAKRLERAVAVLQTRLEQVKKEARQSAGSLFDFDRSKLADELDEARARESELEEAGREASEALGRAIEELRGAMKPGAA